MNNDKCRFLCQLIVAVQLAISRVARSDGSDRER